MSGDKPFWIIGADHISLQFLAGGQVVFVPVEVLINSDQLRKEPSRSGLDASFMNRKLLIERYPQSVWIVKGYDERRMMFVVVHERALATT